MTEEEFKTQLLPVLSGRFPRMIAKPRGNSEFDKAAAKEANRKIWGMLNRYPVDDVIDETRNLSLEDPEISASKALSVLRQRLEAKHKQSWSSAAWTWQDELNLRFVLAMPAAKKGRWSVAEIAWSRFEKNPSPFERQEATRIINEVHINGTHKRMMERGSTREHCERMVPFLV